MLPMTRDDLRARLHEHYRKQGWATRADGERVVLAAGPGGVTWVGAAVCRDDLAAGRLDSELAKLAERRMATGELCPLELLPAPGCESELAALLERLGLSERRHVAVYSLGA